MFGKSQVPVFIGVLLVGVIILGWVYWPRGPKALPPPPALAETALTASQPEARVEAAQQLAAWGNQAQQSEEVRSETTPQYRRVYQASNDPIVKAEMLRGILAARDWKSMPVVLEGLKDESPLVRGRAGAAARKLLGVDLGFRANASERNRAVVIEVIEKEFADMQAGYGAQGPSYGTSKSE